MTELAATPRYPVAMTLSPPEDSSRLWAVPLFGFLIKCLILIPHLIVLYVLGIAVAFAELVIWIPVLFTARYPDWAYALVAGYLLGIFESFVEVYYGVGWAQPGVFVLIILMLIIRPNGLFGIGEVRRL